MLVQRYTISHSGSSLEDVFIIYIFSITIVLMCLFQYNRGVYLVMLGEDPDLLYRESGEERIYFPFSHTKY